MRIAGVFIRANYRDALHLREIVSGLSPVCKIDRIPDNVEIEELIDLIKGQGVNWTNFGDNYHQLCIVWQEEWPHQWEKFQYNTRFETLIRDVKCESEYAA